MLSVLWILVIPLLLQMHVHGSGEIWTDNNEIWMQTAAGPRQLTQDGIPKRLPVLAPGGNRLAYVIDIQSPEPRNRPPEEKVILVESTGRVLRPIIPEGYVPETFERPEWIDDRRIGAMTCGHANCMYWILDSDSGKTLQVMEGGFPLALSELLGSRAFSRQGCQRASARIVEGFQLSDFRES
jgi:hypothetical protein